MLILVFSKTITLFLAVILLSTIAIIPILSFADNPVMSPRKQMASGIAAEDVVCKSGFALMKRTSGSAACIKPVSAEKLANTGFGIIIKEATITETEQKDNRPNILVVVLDDTGFADYAFTGSEISTPNLDSLRNEGKLFTNFHTNPTCSPTRSVLMTGVDNHLNGFGSMAEFIAGNQKGMPGYEGYLNDNVVTIPQLLKDNGYHTYMVGKWHLAYGISDPTNDWEKWTKYDPHARGFEETFTVEIPGSHFTNLGEDPIHVPIATRNGVQVDYPQQYIDDVFTDNMIQFIDKNHEDEKPMFMYLSFWNNHWPIQAPQEYIKKYEGKYDVGWDKIREQRFDKQKELGLIPQDMQLPPRNNLIPAWDSLNATQQEQEAKKMEIFAAMLDSLDNNLGRAVNHLKEIGEYDNTMIVVFADNGAESTDPTKKVLHSTGGSEMNFEKWLETTYDNSFENWGNGNSMIGIGLGWSQVGNTPLLREKGFETEGGTRVPMLVKLPNKIQESSSNAFSRVTDVAITILDYAQVQHPGTTYNGQLIAPVDGKSLRPILEDKAQRVYGDDEAVGAELFGNSALYKGDWKVSKHVFPFGDDTWKLYNLKTMMSMPKELESFLQ
ncbi:MAG: arylsulfatase [Candidatus Nitrosotenuis sp.]|nr:arylsulfatase [Candidatus Nitrosotenuis sp.]